MEIVTYSLPKLARVAVNPVTISRDPTSQRTAIPRIQQQNSIFIGGRAKDLRTMKITTAGKGGCDLMVSYVSEVLVCKSPIARSCQRTGNSNRCCEAGPSVDNTSGEDWKDVQLSLVADSPQSLVQPISQPTPSTKNWTTAWKHAPPIVSRAPPFLALRALEVGLDFMTGCSGW